jgi:rhamnosyltransferase
MIRQERNKPKCLVIMASCNGEKWIKDQIVSIFKQENVSIKLLISDDLSKDLTLKIINDLKKSNYDIDIVQRSLASGSAGQNFMSIFRMLNFKHYDFIAYSDQDDVWLPFKLSRAIEKIYESNSSGYSSSVNAFWSDRKSTVLSQSPNLRQYDFLFEGAGQGCTFVLTSKFFSKFQEFCILNQNLSNKFYYHDWLTYLYCRSKNEKWFFDDVPTLNYRQHVNNDTGARSGLNAILNRWRLISSGWYKKQIIIAYNLVTKTGYQSPKLSEFEAILDSRNTIKNKMRYISFVWKHGRRKAMDRLVLVTAILFSKL